MFRKSLKVRRPGLLSSKSGAANCCVVVRAIQSFLNWFENRGRAELLHRAAAHFREADAQHHLVRRHAFLLLQQVDDVLLLLDVAGGDVGGLVDDVLARDRAGDDDVLAAAGDA